MSAPSKLSRRLVVLSLAIALVGATLGLAGCSPTVDTRLVGKWSGKVASGATMTYTFREDGNLDVESSATDTGFPSQWSALSWEGDDITIRWYDYQQTPVVWKVKMKGTDEFEAFGEGDAVVGTFKRDAS